MRFEGARTVGRVESRRLHGFAIALAAAWVGMSGLRGSELLKTAEVAGAAEPMTISGLRGQTRGSLIYVDQDATGDGSGVDAHHPSHHHPSHSQWPAG